MASKLAGSSSLMSPLAKSSIVCLDNGCPASSSDYKEISLSLWRSPLQSPVLPSRTYERYDFEVHLPRAFNMSSLAPSRARMDGRAGRNALVVILGFIPGNNTARILFMSSSVTNDPSPHVKIGLPPTGFAFLLFCQFFQAWTPQSRAAPPLGLGWFGTS